MRVDHTLHINAPVEAVWAVTIDVERWPELTPTITSVKRLDSGPFGPGSKALIKQPALPESEWTVTEFKDGERFSWETRMPGLRMAGSHVLTADASGTRNGLGVEVSGFVGVFLWPLLRIAIRNAIAQENQGFKRECESRSKA